MSWRLLYIIDLWAVGLFAISYYRCCYRKGYRIDIWHAQLFMTIVLPYMLMLPFERNELNEVIVGQDFEGIVSVMPTVFLITILGFLSFLAGGLFWKLRLGVGVRKATARWLDKGPQCSRMLMSSRDLLVSLSLVSLSLQAIMLAIYFKNSGFGLDVRGYTFANPGIRPFAQVAALSTVVVASHCLARYVDTKEKILLVCTLALSVGLMFFGQRTNIALIYLNVGLCYLVKLRRRVSLLRVFGWTAAVALAVLYLGNVREGIYSVGEFLGSLAFLAIYGNTFCDLRDFGWIYAHWDHHLWLGKTYLAGLETFVPRGLSDFRATWSFGIATDWTVGLDTELHPGLKPGTFGECFFNFGWIGPVVVGLILGIVVRRVDIEVKQAMESGGSMREAFSSTMLLTVSGCFAVSLGLPALYALAGVYLLGWLWLRARAMTLPKRIQLPT